MKIAVLDLGTNTFHLLIAEVGRDRGAKTIFKSKVVVKLGEGAIHRGVIAPKPFMRGIKALKHYARIISNYKPAKVYAFATSGIRSAKNGKKFTAAAKREAGIDIKVIPGSREAELIYYGVRECVKMTERKMLIMDIGGGSTEFIIANKSRIFWKKSFDIGASRLLEAFRPSDPVTVPEVKKLEKYLSKVLKPLDSAIKKFPPAMLTGSSGSFDTFAEMIGWKYYKKDVLKNVVSYRFRLSDYLLLHRLLLNSTIGQRMKMKGLIKMRVDMIVLSSICTHYILKKYAIKEMQVSKYALKEGAMWKIIQQLGSG